MLGVIFWLISGYISWIIVEPQSFGGAILFLIVWGIVKWLSIVLLAVIITGISKKSY